jgi:hypothetical protein
MKKLILSAVLLTIAATTYADDYTLEWTPGGANIRDVTPKPAPGAAALDAAILALQMQLANAPLAKHATDVFVYIKCEKLVRYVVLYSNGTIEDQSIAPQAFDVDELTGILKKQKNFHAQVLACDP